MNRDDGGVACIDGANAKDNQSVKKWEGKQDEASAAAEERN